jgi:MFS family permease
MVAGLVPVVGGMAWLGQLTTGTGYFPGVLVPMLLLGIGMGVAFVPLTMAALAGVAPRDSGAAASMVNVMQQVGGSLGLAILVTVYGTASRAAASHPPAGASAAARVLHARVHGMASSFTVAAVFDLVALLVVAVAIRIANPHQPDRLADSDRNTARAEIAYEVAEAEILESEVVG